MVRVHVWCCASVAFVYFVYFQRCSLCLYFVVKSDIKPFEVRKVMLVVRVDDRQQNDTQLLQLMFFKNKTSRTGRVDPQRQQSPNFVDCFFRYRLL